MRIALSPLLIALFLTACNAKPETVKAEAPAEVWTLQPGASVAFTSVKNTNLPVSGKFTDVTGAVDLARFPALAGTIRVAVASLDTGNPGRDQNIFVHFFEGEKPEYQAAEFIPEKFDGPAGATLGDAPLQGKLLGTLRLHGEELGVVLPVEFSRRGGMVHVASTGAANLSIKALDMQAQKGNLLEVCGHESVEDAVAIKLDAMFAR